MKVGKRNNTLKMLQPIQNHSSIRPRAIREGGNLCTSVGGRSTLSFDVVGRRIVQHAVGGRGILGDNFRSQCIRSDVVDRLLHSIGDSILHDVGDVLPSVRLWRLWRGRMGFRQREWRWQTVDWTARCRLMKRRGATRLRCGRRGFRIHLGLEVPSKLYLGRQSVLM